MGDYLDKLKAKAKGRNDVENVECCGSIIVLYDFSHDEARSLPCYHFRFVIEP
jgi:hypothetical protein